MPLSGRRGVQAPKWFFELRFDRAKTRGYRHESSEPKVGDIQSFEEPIFGALRPEFSRQNIHNLEARRHIAALSFLQAKARIEVETITATVFRSMDLERCFCSSVERGRTVVNVAA